VPYRWSRAQRAREPLIGLHLPGPPRRPRRPRPPLGPPPPTRPMSPPVGAPARCALPTTPASSAPATSASAPPVPKSSPPPGYSVHRSGSLWIARSGRSRLRCTDTSPRSVALTKTAPFLQAPRFQRGGQALHYRPVLRVQASISGLFLLAAAIALVLNLWARVRAWGRGKSGLVNHWPSNPVILPGRELSKGPALFYLAERSTWARRWLAWSPLASNHDGSV
jgi:hypothetical protein